MNRKDLVDELSQRFEGNREVAEQALDSVVDVITKSISAGERVVISGFGEFERRAREAGEKAGEYVPEFKPGKELRDVVNGAREWRDRVSESLAVVPAVAVEQASRTAARTMRSVAEKARDLADELSTAGEPEGATRSGRGAKKATAKKTSAAKKGTAKKTSAQKTSAQKAPAKKSSAKKAPAKKSSAKKAPAKKSTTTKSTTTKSTTTSAAKKAPAKTAGGT